MTKPRVVFYATAWCPYCARARSLLEGKGAAIEEIDIDARPDARAEMIERSGRRTVPQIFIGTRHVGGCDDLYELDAAGGLDPLLESGA
ncbi:MAG TPA: glutaredoxin 3 [Steroidobacteraceae bacterium]|nr:glutaredoxin 3 [Steroidobacteraceae bacterium]